MDTTHRLTSLMLSVIPRPASTRSMLRRRRLISVSLWPERRGDGPRRVVAEAELILVASSLRKATRVGDSAGLYFGNATSPMTLEFEGGATRSIRIGRAARGVKTGAVLVAMDGDVFVAPGRPLRFLFDPRARFDQAAEASSATFLAGSAASATTGRGSSAPQRAAGARP